GCPLAHENTKVIGLLDKEPVGIDEFEFAWPAIRNKQQIPGMGVAMREHRRISIEAAGPDLCIVTRFIDGPPGTRPAELQPRGFNEFGEAFRFLCAIHESSVLGRWHPSVLKRGADGLDLSVYWPAKLSQLGAEPLQKHGIPGFIISVDSGVAASMRRQQSV